MRAPRTRDDLILALIIGTLLLLTLYGAALWIAATFIVLIHDQRLLDAASPTILETGIALIGHATTPSQAFAPDDMQQLPRDPYLHVCAVPIVAVLVIAARLAWQLIGGERLARDEKDSRWASARDTKRLTTSKRNDAGRLVLGSAHGRLLATEQHHSVVVFGPTGSGKTTSVVIPALLRHEGPAVALSVKSDLVLATHRQRRDVGDVYVYDPLGLTGFETAAWTPLRACAQWEEAQRMAEALTSAVGDTGLAESRFWDAMAAKMLEPMLHAAALEDLTMRDVVRWVDRREKNIVTNILESHGAKDALQSFQASQKRDERTLSSVYASTEVMLRAYASPSMSDHKPSGSIDPSRLIAENGTLYVVAPTEDQARKDVYRCAVLASERKRKPLDPSLLLVLDEAANIAPIHDLAQIAATSRAYAIQLVTIFQDHAQVTARYKHQAGTVINNHTAKLLLAGTSDHELLQMMTRLLGDETTEQQTIQAGPSGLTHSTQLRQRPLAAMHQLRQLTRDRALLLYANLPPVVIRLHPHYHREDAA
jgi:type IV secretory pathway TraG/TraD family ATPase VirD4